MKGVSKTELSVLLNRQKEIFDAYIENNGCITGLTELKNRYAEEDGRKSPYTDSYIINLFNEYISNNNFSEEDAVKLKKARVSRLKVLYKRGEELLNAYIAGLADIKALEEYKEKYTLEDKCEKPYSFTSLKKWMDICLKHTKKKELVEKYKNVMYLVSHTKTSGNSGVDEHNYTVELINTICKYESESLESAVSFVKSINVSKTTLQSLLSLYSSIYPANNREVKFVKSVIDECFNNKSSNLKYVDDLQDALTPRLIKMMNILEEYVASEDSYITDKFLASHSVSRNWFTEALKDLKKVENKVLQMLIQKYYQKFEEAKERNRESIELIKDGIINKVQAGDRVRSFNLYDFYSIVGQHVDEKLYFSTFCLNRGTWANLSDFAEKNVKKQKIFKTVDELLDNCGTMTIGERTATEEDKCAIAYFLYINKWPLSIQLFDDTMREYLYGNLDLEIIKEEKQEESVNKL